MDIPELLAQVLLRPIRKHGDDDTAIETPGDIQRHREGGTRRDPREKSFFARRPADLVAD